MQENIIILGHSLETLTVFRGLLKDPVIIKFRELTRSIEDQQQMHLQISNYCSFVSCLYDYTTDLGAYIFRKTMENENHYIKALGGSGEKNPLIGESVIHELSLLEELSRITPDDVKKYLIYGGFLPQWSNSVYDFSKEYSIMLTKLPYRGYGIFAGYRAFTVENGDLIPVKYPDPQKLDELYGYERERELIIKNTEALVNGKGAGNVLLYGDAGTGKSSTVKAVANHFASRGLRLVEVKKNQLFQIPAIMDQLAPNPLKFILFIDDLSFDANDDNFSALKAILEGSITSRGNNAAIYATSNRRHLVRETMSQRTGDELHVNDTLQEVMSLSARFGLTVTYLRPDKDEYLHIVNELASEYGINIPQDQLAAKAEAHAIRSNGRSPRTAKQFIELLKLRLDDGSAQNQKK